MDTGQRVNLFLIAVLISALALIVPTPQSAYAATILRVTETGLASGACGADWTTNACSLQNALARAVSGDEIWVAGGTYRPGAAGVRTATFQLKNGVAVYGGFAGTETSRDARDRVAYPTLLSGDLDSSGTLTASDAYHVVTGSGTDASAVLDGFTIRGGNADSYPNDHGGGMVNVSGSPALTHVTFSDNSAYNGGGGMANDRSNPTLTHVVFNGNSAFYGGGMYNDYSSSPALTNVTFSGNSAAYGGGMLNNAGSSPALTDVTFSGNLARSNGGGMQNSSSSPALTNVSFSGNSATYSGGGMVNTSVSNPTLTNVTFNGNSATYGGGMSNSSYSFPMLTNVTFSDNSAAGNGGGISNSSSGPRLANSILWGNTAPSGAQIYDDASWSTIAYSDIQGAFPGGSWDTGLGTDGGNNKAADPLFVDADGADNDPGTADDLLRLSAGSPASDAGSNGLLPADTADLDGDGNTTEPLPYDLAGGPRIVNGTVDMGAYEGAYALNNLVWFVDDGGAAGSVCTSWADACPDLQTALALAVSGNEIWVAAGTYRPGAAGARTATFQLKKGVAIYGGFAGAETSREARDWAANLTLLSGDLDSSGTLTDGDAYHVVTGSGTDATAVLDGCTIRGGKASGSNSGGGMINVSGSPMLTNVTFNGNSAEHGGGGMYNMSYSSPTLTNVTFSDNSATGSGTFSGGGGMYNDRYSNPALTNVTFSGNSTTSSGGGMYNFFSSPTLTHVAFNANLASWGGGMINEYGSPTLTDVTFTSNSAAGGGGMFNEYGSPTLTDVTFILNSATSSGGGMLNDYSNPTLTNVTFSDNSATGNDTFSGGGGMGNGGSSPTLTNVTFSGNSATYGSGGGMYNDNYSNPALTNVTFSDNSAGGDGGGMYNYFNSSPTLMNIGFNGNSASFGGGMYNYYNSSPTLTGVTFSGNSALQYGGGILNYFSSNPTLTNISFSSNSADDGGGMYNSGSSPTLTNISFNGNSAGDGGGMYNADSSSPTLTNVSFGGNPATNYGGGMFNKTSSPKLTNVTFSSNSAQYGGGMFNYGSSGPTLTGVTFSGNSATTYGGGIYNSANSYPALVNSILWGNTATYSGAQIENYALWPSIAYTDIQGAFAGGSWDTGLGTDGGGNLDGDPRFVDADGADNDPGTPDDNLRLSTGSPASDAGSNGLLPPDTADLDGDGNTTEPLPYDLDGSPRIVNGTVDMGAYEYQGPPAPTVTASRSGNNIILTFPYVSADITYQVWRSSSAYFAPGEEGSAELEGICTNDGVTVTCTYENAIGDPTANSFTMVRALYANGTYADSKGTGVFGFALAPGVQ